MTIVQRRPQSDRILEARITAAMANIRNALVPVRTVAEVLHHPGDRQSQDRCARILEREVVRIATILDEL